MLGTFRKIAYRLSRSDILFWTLPLLMVLIVLGTVAQKQVGLYAAQKAYFESFVTFIGPVPFPGGALLIGILFVNLLMKFLLFSEWRWIKSGIILTHFGVLILLFGGLVTGLTSREGYLSVREGETSSRIEDYYQRQLSVERDGAPVFHLAYEKLSNEMKIASPAFPFTFTIDTHCFNCAIERRGQDESKTRPAFWQGPGRFMKLTPARALPKNEENLTGIEFTIKGTEADGSYVTFDKFPKPPVFKVAGHAYTVTIDREARQLPFVVSLRKFEEGLYPGSDKAKSYRSVVEVKDSGETWQTVIEMNRPLRYRGYTLYQSSFDISGDGRYTVLNVVENKGRLFPYVSSLIVAAGLILHLLIRARRGGSS